MNTRRGGAVLVVALVLGLSAGCSAQSPALTRSTSDELTAGIVDVAEAASVGDLATALAALDTVQQRLDTATASDDVTADRAARIQLSLDVVRTDLETLAAAQTAQVPPAEGAQDPVEPDPVEPVPVEPTTPAPVVTPQVQPEPSETGSNGVGVPGEKSTGKGEDKGKGKKDD